MAQMQRYVIPKWALQMLNNAYEIEQKLLLHGDTGNAQRNVERIKDIFLAGNIFSIYGGDADDKAGLFYENPLGQVFNETRTDLEVSISGESTENLLVVEVSKPIIRYGTAARSQVVQKGIVVVKSNSDEKTL